MVGKKKRGHPDLEEILSRPWCYYCERDFDDLKILISHQKAKHFKCERCSRRLNTAGGLSVHMNQVHKETLTSVDNALPNRASLDVEIFGMEGIPEDVKQTHNQRIIADFYQQESARRAASGNHGPGGNGANPSKKPKFESPGDLKARLAAHKARKAELAANGGVSSGDATPAAGVPNAQSPAPGFSPGIAQSPYAPPPVPYGAPAPTAGYGFTPESYGQAPSPAPYGAPPYQPPSFAAPGAQYAPPPAPYGAAPPYAPQPTFSPGPYQQGPFGPPPPQFGAGTPPVFNAYPPPPGPPGSLPARPANLPQAPGLPSRPSFSGPPGGPPVAQFPMHQPPPQQGGWGGQNGWNGPDHHNPAMSSAYPPPNQGYNDGHATNGSNGAFKEPDDIDEMIRQAELGIKPIKKENSNPPPTPAPSAQAQAPTPTAPPPAKKEATPEVAVKKEKKQKEIPKMVYHDEEVSPEEKMAKLPRYAFVPEKKDETTLVDANQVPGVAGTVDN